MSNVYLCTAIPYVNGNPHIGHAMDYLLADTYARYRRLIGGAGDEVRLSAGTDEHGNKVFRSAESAGMSVEEYSKLNSDKFRNFINKMDVTYTDFIRTTDPEHARRCQEIWQKLTPHIYAAEYDGWYCEGCESFVTQKEHDENHGICPDHQKPYEHLTEKNYYLRIADFKEQITAAIESDQMQILPAFRKTEALKLLADAPDVSISRPRNHLSWGIPVPGDEEQVMYVWMDALPNYITVLGYPDQDISAWWPATAQFIGKDILRFHTIIWPAILLGLGLPLPKHMVTHGHILANGQKMSKSLGNVVDPVEVMDRHGLDAFRYFFLAHVDTFLDSDFTWEKFDAAYNNELANDLGNLVQRLATLCHKNNILSNPDYHPALNDYRDTHSEYFALMDRFEFTKAFAYVWQKVQAINKAIDEQKPWELAKQGKTAEVQQVLSSLVQQLDDVNNLLAPLIPNASARIHAILHPEPITTAQPIVPPATPLFPKA